MKSQVKLQVTKNYGLFREVLENRAVNLNTRPRRDLKKSMQTHGYLPAYPLYCTRKNGSLEIRDGQHRLATARALGLPVWYVVCDEVAEVAAINNTQCKWKLCDYAEAFAKGGNQNYQEVLDFAEAHKIGISDSVMILAGSVGETGFGGGVYFKKGLFVVHDRPRADRVVRLYYAMKTLCDTVRGRGFIPAIIAFCRIDGVDDDRLIMGARKRPQLLIKYGTRDGYLMMFETLYNFGRARKVPIKIDAENVIAGRHKGKNIPS